MSAGALFNTNVKGLHPYFLSASFHHFPLFNNDILWLLITLLGTGHWSEGSLVRKLYSRTFRGEGEGCGNPTLHTLPHPFDAI